MKTSIEIIKGHRYEITRNDKDEIVSMIGADPMPQELVDPKIKQIAQKTSFTLDDIAVLLIYLINKNTASNLGS